MAQTQEIVTRFVGVNANQLWVSWCKTERCGSASFRTDVKEAVAMFAPPTSK
jgi:hypothetical protein